MRNQIIVSVLALIFCAAASAMSPPNWFSVGSDTKTGTGLWVDLANAMGVQEYRGVHLWMRVVDAKTNAAAAKAWTDGKSEEQRSAEVNDIIQKAPVKSVEVYLNCDTASYHLGDDKQWHAIDPSSGIGKLTAGICTPTDDKKQGRETI